MTTRLQSYGRPIEDLAFSGNMHYDQDTTTGLTFGHKGGYHVSAETRTVVAAGTVALTDDATNWIYMDGAVPTVNAGAAPTGSEVLYKVTTATGAITDIIDYRGAIITDKTSFT